MQNQKISRQLFALVAIIAAIFSAVTAYQINASISAIYAERYEMLRTQVESGLSIIQSFYDREKSGELSHEAAQASAYAAVAAMRYEPAGYIYALDYNHVTRIHFNAKTVGYDHKNKLDKMGKLYSDEIVSKGRNGGGITEYFWEKPGISAEQAFKKVVYSRSFEPWEIVLATGVYVDDLEAKVRQNVIGVVTFGLGAFIAALGVAYLVIRNITKPLAAVHCALEAVADENVSLAIPHTNMRNEIGLMATATKTLQTKVRERHAMAEKQDQQAFELEKERMRNAQLQQQEAADQAHVVLTIGGALETLASGDLTVRCADLGPNYDAVRQNFNKAIDRLEAAMSRVHAKGRDISSLKEDIRRASIELSQRTERQAANLEETSAALDELTVAVRQTADGAHDAAGRVSSVTVEAERSDRIVTDAIEAMSGIEQSSDEISKIIGVIDDIAFQTNLLALNAGVEAARAGESGKGFAVVAQEVRELAQRSAAAAKQIKDQISRSSGQVQNGVQLVGEAGAALKRISVQVRSASDIVGKIAHSAREQDSTLRSISTSLNQLDAATQHNAAMAEETTASTEALAGDTDQLMDLIDTFTLGTNMSSAAHLHAFGRQMRRTG